MKLPLLALLDFLTRCRAMFVHAWQPHKGWVGLGYAALQSARAQHTALLTETRKTALDALTEANQKAASLAQELTKAPARHADTRLTAPVDGTVQQLATHTIGGVVREAEALMILVPRDNPLEVEAMIENKDIGFVNAQQHAEVKIDTFQYTKYGTIPATVHSIANDAVNDEKRGLLYR